LPTRTSRCPYEEQTTVKKKKKSVLAKEEIKTKMPKPTNQASKNYTVLKEKKCSPRQIHCRHNFNDISCHYSNSFTWMIFLFFG